MITSLKIQAARHQLSVTGDVTLSVWDLERTQRVAHNVSKNKDVNPDNLIHQVNTFLYHRGPFTPAFISRRLLPELFKSVTKVEIQPIMEHFDPHKS